MSLLDRIKKHIDNAPPLPAIGRDPYWTRSSVTDDDEETLYDLSTSIYDEDHFYCVEKDCWVRRSPTGVYYLSISYEDWDLFPEDDNSMEEIQPKKLLTRGEYEDLPKGTPY